MITWKEVHAVILQCGDVALSQGVCQNIAAKLNQQIRLADIVPPPQECHASALIRHVECTFANPCARCKDKRPHPHD